MNDLTAPLVIALAVRLCCIARGISLIELFRAFPEMSEGGLYNASISGLVASQKGWLRLNRVAARIPPSLYKTMVVLDALTVVCLCAWPLQPVLLLCAAALLTIQLNRQYMACDGADELVLVTLVASLIGSVGGAFGAAAWFLAGEACLSYFVAGSYKVASPVWKRGKALQQIARTHVFGNEGLSRLFGARPSLVRSIQMLTVGWECVFAVALAAPSPVVWILMAAGAGFHFACAWVMGLNSFPWAFLACYPAVLYANSQVRESLGPWGSMALAAGLGFCIAAFESIPYFRSVRKSTQAAAELQTEHAQAGRLRENGIVETRAVRQP